MHKFIIGIFTQIKNLFQLCNLVYSFLIIITLLCWIENIIKAQWNWLNWIKPTIDSLLNFMNNIYSFSFSAFGTVFDLKYLNTVILLLIIILISKLLLKMIENLEYFYYDKHILFKKEKEKIFNRQLIHNVEIEEKRITKYKVFISTKISKKFSHKEIHVDLDEQNKLMNEFIYSKTLVKHMTFNDGFLYNFDDFDHIDSVLDVLFKVMKSEAPLDYLVCIQAGDDLAQLQRLSDLKLFGQIVTCADTVLRYKFNKSHRYATKNVGIFQKENGTVEVHEFNKITL